MHDINDILALRSYALQNAGVRVIWDLGNDTFRSQLERQPEVLERISTGLLSAVEAYRWALCMFCMCVHASQYAMY